MKQILIIAGPNGAGKTSFAEEFLPQEAGCPEFVNADLIAAGLSPFQPEQVAFTAGRLMLERIQVLAKSAQSFAFETTLSSRSYLQKIPHWQQVGYRVELLFLKLPSPDYAVRRVQQRVQLGGHDIPVETIHRRFAKGWQNFQTSYKNVVDQWFLYDSSHMPPKFTESVDSDQIQETAARYNAADSQKAIASQRAGIEAALLRAAEKAVARARAAGLEPVLAPDQETPKTEASHS